MAAKKEAVSEETQEDQLPAASNTNFALSTDLVGEMEQLDDLGYSERAEDSMIPILAILQDNSGEVKARHSRRIDGANAGDLIIRSIQKVIEMSDKSAPLVFQPCAFQHVWVEWQGEVGEGVPVGQFPFDDMPSDAVEKPNPENPDRNDWVRSNGNRLVDTRYHFGHVIGEDGSLMPLVVPMAGTNHSVSRQWTAQMKQFMIPNTSKRAPAFLRMYALKTKYRERGTQSWFNFDVKDLGWIQDESTIRAGLALLKSVTDNKVQANVSEMGGDGVSDPDDLPI